MASRDSNAAKLTPSKSPRTRNAASARTPPHPNKTPVGGGVIANAKTPTPKKRSGVGGKVDDDNEPPKPVVSRYSVILQGYSVQSLSDIVTGTL